MARTSKSADDSVRAAMSRLAAPRVLSGDLVIPSGRTSGLLLGVVAFLVVVAVCRADTFEGASGALFYREHSFAKNVEPRVLKYRILQIGPVYSYVTTAEKAKQRLKSGGIVGFVDLPIGVASDSFAAGHAGAIAQLDSLEQDLKAFPKSLEVIAEIRQEWAESVARRTATNHEDTSGGSTDDAIYLTSGTRIVASKVVVKDDGISAYTESGVRFIAAGELTDGTKRRLGLKPPAGAAANEQTPQKSQAAEQVKQQNNTGFAKVDAASIDFKGSLLDFCVKLTSDYDCETAIDPLAFREEGIVRSDIFEKRADEPLLPFLTRRVEDLGLKLEQQGKYLYVTSDSFTVALKVSKALRSKNYEQIAGLKDDQTLGSGVSGGLSELAAIGVEIERRHRGSVTALRSLMESIRRAEKTARSRSTANALSDPSPGDLRIAMDKEDEADRARDQIVSILMEQLTFVANLDDRIAAKIPNIGAVASSNSIIAIITDIKRNAFASLLASFEYTNSEIRGLQEGIDVCRDRISELKVMAERLSHDEERYRNVLKTALNNWHAGDVTRAFETLAGLQEMGGMTDPEARLAYGVLAIKIKAENVRKLREDLQGGNSVEDGAIKLHFAEHELAPEVVKIVQSEVQRQITWQTSRFRNHPGRTGVIDGLSVYSSTAMGVVSPKAIQLLNKLPSERRTQTKDNDQNAKVGIQDLNALLNETGDEQIEVHGLSVKVDSYMVASIKDSLQYVVATRYPDLYEKHRISVVFDETVNVNHGGDSAGTAFALAAISIKEAVAPAANVCATGAMRPYGDVSPVGGIYPKVKAAMEAGYRTILVPSGNKSDLELLPSDIVDRIQIVTGDRLDDYLVFTLPSLSAASGAAAAANNCYLTALNLYQAGDVSKSRFVLERFTEAFPNHFSADALLRRIRSAGSEMTSLSGESLEQLELWLTAAKATLQPGAKQSSPPAPARSPR